jgi:hypothetical protein
MASLDEVRDDYCDENLPVLLLLGLVSALRRLDPLLPPPGAPPACPEPEVGRDVDVREGRFLYLVLGLIAFRGHLHSVLTPIRDAGPRAAPRVAPHAEAPAAGVGAKSPGGPRAASTEVPGTGTPSAPLPGLRELLR